MSVMARCCVRVIQLSRSSQASPWLEHQDDFSEFRCIGYRELGACVMARSAKFLTGLTIILIGFLRMLCACGGLRGG